MTTTETRQEIAGTILDQIGGRVFRTMTGAKDFIALESGLRLTIGRNAKNVRTIDIVLDSSDTYTVKFYNVRGRVLSETSMVYADALRGMIEDNTGLRTSMTRIYGTL